MGRDTVAPAIAVACRALIPMTFHWGGSVRDQDRENGAGRPLLTMAASNHFERRFASTFGLIVLPDTIFDLTFWCDEDASIGFHFVTSSDCVRGYVKKNAKGRMAD